MADNAPLNTDDSSGGGAVSGNLTEEESFAKPYNIHSSQSMNRSINSLPSVSPLHMESESSGAFNIALQQGNVQRSWIDPWEMTPSAKLYQKNYESPTRHMVATSILAQSNMNSNPNIYSINTISNVSISAISSQNNNYSSPLLDQVIPENDDFNIYDEEDEDVDIEIHKNDDGVDGVEVYSGKKFGPWDGVMTGALLNIWGVIMFLRLGWIIGQSGIIGTILIIILATTVTTLTTISMSAICTNGKIRAGGAYYIISRTIGPQFGGSVGILLTLGSMVAVSLYLLGFAESFAENLENFDFSITNSQINDIRIWSSVFLVICLIMAIVSLNLVIKAQIGLLMWIFLSIILLVVGSFYRTGDGLYGVGEGFSNGNFHKNLKSDYDSDYNFWLVLAIFFPAVTGIMAGANISGDLRDPSQDIPRGTLTAIIISSTVYIILTILIGATAERDALKSDTLIMTKICVWFTPANSYIIYIGVYAATLSSAIASLVGAPRILMAVGNDRILNLPGLNFFTKANKEGNPIRGYYLTFCVAVGVNIIGKIDLVAPLISQFFIMVYLLINFSCFMMTIAKSPGWRPSFKYFNGYTALFGTILCLIVMFLLDPLYASVTLGIAFITYVYIAILDPDVAWGGAFHSRAIYQAYRSLLNLALTDSESTQLGWRPSFLLTTFSKQYSLTKFIETLRKGHSLIFSCQIIRNDYRKSLIKKLNEQHYKNSLILTNRKNKSNTYSDSSYVSLKKGYLPVRQFTHKSTKIKGKRSLGFSDVIITDSTYRNCMQTVLQNCGLGLLKPNTLIMNLLRDIGTDDEDKNNKLKKDNDDDNNDEKEKENNNNNINKNENKQKIPTDEYVEIIRDTLLYGYGIMICNGLCDVEKFHKIDWNQPNCFENIIDVWWIVDDGGLTLLLPYIMCLCKFWSKCKVRINLIKDENLYNNHSHAADHEEEQFAKIQELIAKFRLNKTYYDKPRIISVKNNNPSQETIGKFEKLSQCKIQNTNRQNVILRWLRLSELLQENSKQSAMIIVTLPVPTSYIKTKQYMAILHLLSDQNLLPPTILMRGNGEQALTFYSE